MAKPSCLLLPGTLCDARLFDPLQKCWLSYGSHIEAITADLHTLSAHRETWWQMLLNALPARFNVLAFSLGGILAMELLRLVPQRVQKMVLVAVNAHEGTALHQVRADQQLHTWKTMGPRALASQLFEQASPTCLDRSQIQACIQDMAAATPDGAFQEQLKINVSRPTGLPVLTAWQGDLMLVSGADDPWCGADKQQAIQTARSDAKWHDMAGCGHYVPLEQPSMLAHWTHPFLSDIQH